MVNSPAGRIDQWPPFGSRMRAKTAGLSKRGRQSQSIEPSLPASAAELQSDRSPYEAIGLEAPALVSVVGSAIVSLILCSFVVAVEASVPAGGPALRRRLEPAGAETNTGVRPGAVVPAAYSDDQGSLKSA